MLRVFNHYIPTSIIWLVIIEFIVIYFSVFLGVEVRFAETTIPEDRVFLEWLSPKAGAFALILSISMTAVGLHTRNIVDDFASMMIRIALSFGLGFVGHSLIYYIYPDLFLGRGILLISALFAFFGILITRTIYQKLDARLFTSRVIVMGTGKKAKLIEDIEIDAAKRGQSIIGYVDLDEDHSAITIPQEKILKIKWNRGKRQDKNNKH